MYKTVQFLVCSQCSKHGAVTVCLASSLTTPSKLTLGFQGAVLALRRSVRCPRFLHGRLPLPFSKHWCCPVSHLTLFRCSSFHTFFQGLSAFLVLFVNYCKMFIFSSDLYNNQLQLNMSQSEFIDFFSYAHYSREKTKTRLNLKTKQNEETVLFLSRLIMLSSNQ